MAQNIFRKCITIIVAFITAGLCVHLNAEQKAKPVIKYFDVERFIPQDLYETNDDYFIRWPQQTQVDSKGIVYIADYEQDCIKVFTHDGKFIKRIGRSGEGPGEFRFEFPAGHTFYIDSNDILYVYNNHINPRIQVFNANGTFLRGYSFKKRRNISSMVVDKSGRIICSTNCTQTSLDTIFVLKRSGDGYEFERTFAPQPFKNFSLEAFEKKYKGKRVPQELNTGSKITINENDEIFQVFLFYPLIRKFSKDGILIWSKTINVLEHFPILDSEVARNNADLDVVNLPMDELIEKRPENGQIFASDIVCVPGKKKLLIQLLSLSSILELDCDANVTGLYCPKDMEKKKNSDLIPRYIKSDIILSAFHFSYNAKHCYIIATAEAEYLRKIIFL